MFREMPQERWPAGCRNWLNIGKKSFEYDSLNESLPAVPGETWHCREGSQPRKSAETAGQHRTGEAPAESHRSGRLSRKSKRTVRIGRTS